jgi:hypothetical protein
MAYAIRFPTRAASLASPAGRYSRYTWSWIRPRTPSASALEAGLRRGSTFGLARAPRGLDLLEDLNAITLLPQPVDSLSRDVGIHNDAVAGLPSPDDDHPELVTKLGQVTLIASGNEDVEYGHGSAIVALIQL